MPCDTGLASFHLHCVAISGLLRGNMCERFASRPARRRLPGQSVFVTGDRADSVYLVKSGLVRTSLSSKDDELTMQLYAPGQIFGELCFCSRTRRESAAAVESSEIIEIPLTDLVEQLRRTPESALDFIVALTEQLAASNERLHSLAFESAMERLCRTLLLLTETLGEESPDGTHITRYIRQEQLAQLVAARREVVSGLLNRLRERGLIRYPRKGQISVQKLQLLEYLNWRRRARHQGTRY